MADTRSIYRLPTGPIVDVKTGNFTPEGQRFFNTLLFGGGTNTIGKVNSGVAEAQAAAEAAEAAAVVAQEEAAAAASDAAEATGEAASAVAAVEALNANAGSSSGTVQVSASAVRVSGSRSGAGSVTTASVTLTISGGTSPYTVDWDTYSGDVFAAGNDPESGVTSTHTTDFSITITSGQYAYGTMQATVTDSAGTPNTTTINVVCTASDTSGIAP
jgi:hypothetical protein